MPVSRDRWIMDATQFSWQKTILRGEPNGRLEREEDGGDATETETVTAAAAYLYVPAPVSASEEVVGYVVHHHGGRGPLRVKRVEGQEVDPDAPVTIVHTGTRSIRLEWDVRDLEAHAPEKKWTVEDWDERGETCTWLYDARPVLSEESRNAGARVGVRYDGVPFPAVTVYVL